MWRNLKFTLFFVVKSVLWWFTLFFEKYVLSRFSRFYVEKNWAKNCIGGDKMTNMRYACDRSIHLNFEEQSNECFYKNITSSKIYCTDSIIWCSTFPMLLLLQQADCVQPAAPVHLQHEDLLQVTNGGWNVSCTCTKYSVEAKYFCALALNCRPS